MPPVELIPENLEQVEAPDPIRSEDRPTPFERENEPIVQRLREVELQLVIQASASRLLGLALTHARDERDPDIA